MVVALNTYSAPYNDGKLDEVGARVGSIVAATGDLATLWAGTNVGRVRPRHEVVVLPTRLHRRPAATTLRGLRQVVERVRPTLVHIECEPWQAVAIQAVSLAARMAVPVGIQFAENGPQMRGVGGRVRRALAAWTLRRCQYAIGWSTESSAIARSLVPSIYTETIPGTGVPRLDRASTSLDEWFGADCEDLRKIAYVGRFSEEKGIADFLAICDELAGRLPLRVAIAGGDVADRTVAEWAASRPWAHQHGVVTRPAAISLLAASDVLVCPSRTTRHIKEQFGKAPVEAMASGTPVFAYDCGALSDVIGDGGVVVPEGDQRALVAELERHLASSTERRDDLAMKARERSRLFTDAAVAEQLICVWSKFV